MITLLYHDVVPVGQFSTSGFSGGDADIYKLEIPVFREHLREIGSRVESSKTLASAATVGDDQASVLFTFDDGGRGALHAAELLEQYGFRGHFFITTDWIGKSQFLALAEIRELHTRGHVIGSHSCSHPARMSSCSRAQLDEQWRESLRVLSDACGERLRVASVPGGYYSRKVAETAAAAGIEVLFNSEPTREIIRVDGCMVLGRYSVQQGLSADTVACIACGQWAPRAQQYLYWNLKKIAKQVGGSYYLHLRKSLLNRERARTS